MSTAAIDGADRAVSVVDAFLAEIAAGDIAAAGARLAPDAELVFPGGRTFRDLDALAAASSSRYHWVDKHRDEYMATGHPDGSVTVASIGRLFGENLQGVRFDGVRYIDIFLVRDDAIAHQRVWNDLAETRVLEARSTDELAAPFRPVT